MSELQRHDELAADQALWGRELASLDELRKLLHAAEDGSVEDCLWSWERTAAECTVALAPHRAMPEKLADKVRRDLNKLCVRSPEATPKPLDSGTPPLVEPATAPIEGRTWWLPTLAAAAALVVGILAGQWIADGRTVSSPELGAADGSNPIQRLLTANDVTRLPFQKGPSDLSGDAPGGELVWSDTRQEGYMRIRGLPANAPTESRYQLWIFDSSRAEAGQELLKATPVDGGIFDIPAGDTETVVAIDAKIPVGKGTAFAVTVEGPDGVVVSKRDHIVLLATP